MVQQTLKSDFGAAWLLRLMAAIRPAAREENRRGLRMVEPPVREMAGRSARRFPHLWGAFYRAFIPPCNLEGGRQLSDQSLGDALCIERAGTLVGNCKLWCRDPVMHRHKGCSCTLVT